METQKMKAGRPILHPAVRISVPLASLVFLISLSCRNAAIVPDVPEIRKALTVCRLSFDLERGQYVSPGETVKIFAKANRTSDVLYDWAVSGGSFETIKPDCILYAIPVEPGGYAVKITVTDAVTGEKAEKELVIRVGSESALAVPSRFTYTIEERTSFGMKISGLVSETRISRLTVDGERSRIETEMPEGISVVEMDGEEILVSNASGARHSAGSALFQDGSQQAAGLPDDCFALFCEKLGTPRKTGSEYVFHKVENGIDLLLVLDARSGLPCRTSSRDEITGETVETSYTYQTVDGFVFPESIYQKVRIPVDENIVESEYTMKVRDVAVDPESELFTEGGK